MNLSAWHQLCNFGGWGASIIKITGRSREERFFRTHRTRSAIVSLSAPLRIVPEIVPRPTHPCRAYWGIPEFLERGTLVRGVLECGAL